MSSLVTVLAACSAAVYLCAAAFAVRKRPLVRAGVPALNLLAIAAFGLERFVPQSSAAAAIASVVIIAALLQIARRSVPFSAGVLAAIPLCTMLLTVDRPFFPPQNEAQFQAATIALLCAAAPIAVISLLLERSVFRTKFAR